MDLALGFAEVTRVGMGLSLAEDSGVDVGLSCEAGLCFFRPTQAIVRCHQLFQAVTLQAQRLPQIKSISFLRESNS